MKIRIQRWVRSALAIATAGVIFGVASSASAQHCGSMYSTVDRDGNQKALKIFDGERIEDLPFGVHRASYRPGCRLTIGDTEQVLSYSAPDVVALPSRWLPRGAGSFAYCECDPSAAAPAEEREGKRKGKRGEAPVAPPPVEDSRPPRLSRRAAACIAWNGERFDGDWIAFRRGESERLPRRERVRSIEVADGCRAVLTLKDRPFRVVIDEPMGQLPQFIRRNAQSLDCRCGR